MIEAFLAKSGLERICWVLNREIFWAKLLFPTGGVLNVLGKPLGEGGVFALVVLVAPGAPFEIPGERVQRVFNP